MNYGYGWPNTEEYSAEEENVFKNAKTSPLSTFSIDTDTASYSNLRRYVLNLGMLPPNGAVRTEELINYFDYDNQFLSIALITYLQFQIMQYQYLTMPCYHPYDKKANHFAFKFLK